MLLAVDLQFSQNPFARFCLKSNHSTCSLRRLRVAVPGLIQTPAVARKFISTGARCYHHQASFTREWKAPQHTQTQHSLALRNTVAAAPGVQRSAEEQLLRGASRFPFTDRFEAGPDQWVDSERLVSALQPLLTEQRADTFDKVVAERTFNVLPIVEGLYDAGNFGAVCRTAEALGYGAVHLIKGSGSKYRFKPSRHRNSAGAEKWLDVRVWETPTQCIQAARSAGYQIVATHMGATSVDISSIDFTRPTAIVLGNEAEGVSQETVGLADACAVIPMAGYVESLNVSVAAAMVLYEARSQRISALGRHGDLNADEQRILKAVMLLRHRAWGRQKAYIQHILAQGIGLPATADSAPTAEERPTLVSV